MEPGDADRILLEVMKGKTTSKADAPDQAAYRKALSEETAAILARGGIVEAPKEWL